MSVKVLSPVWWHGAAMSAYLTCRDFVHVAVIQHERETNARVTAGEAFALLTHARTIREFESD